MPVIKDRSLSKGESTRPFYEAMRSPYTRDGYERRLLLFLNYIDLPVDDFVDKAKKDPVWAQKTILDYMLRQKARFQNKEIQASTIRSLIKPIKLLLEMNDITSVNWRKMTKMMPSVRRYALDRSPTMQEMRSIISESDLRFQAITLTMASSGIRIGAWDYLSWGDVEPMRRNGELLAAKLEVYRGEPEEYVTFVTPEAYSKLQEYVKFRQGHGEKVTEDSPLVRDKWQTTTGNWGRNLIGVAQNPIRLQSLGVKRLFEDMMWRLRLRREKKRRHEFSIHSLRKFFKTRAEQVMRPINVETLMGHSTGISDSYYRPTEKELLDDYLNAVPLLTISEAEEVRRESQVSRGQLENRLQQLEDLVARLAAEKGQQVLALDRSRTSGT